MGFEPIRPFEQGILSPQRLPFRHSAFYNRLTHIAEFCKLFLKYRVIDRPEKVFV